MKRKMISLLILFTFVGLFMIGYSLQEKNDWIFDIEMGYPIITITAYSYPPPMVLPTTISIYPTSNASPIWIMPTPPP